MGQREKEAHMANTNNLQSFVAAHERKFQAKVDAAAQGRQIAVHRQPVGDGYSGPLSSSTYRSILQRQFSPKHTGRHTAFMDYELTSR